MSHTYFAWDHVTLVSQVYWCIIYPRSCSSKHKDDVSFGIHKQTFLKSAKNRDVLSWGVAKGRVFVQIYLYYPSSHKDRLRLAANRQSIPRRPVWCAPAHDPLGEQRQLRVAYPLAAANVSRPPRESSEESPSAGRQGSNPVFSSSFTPPCLLGDMPVSIHLPIIFLVKSLPTLVLWPRRHSKQQHLFQAPHMIGQARRPRWGARPPLLD